MLGQQEPLPYVQPQPQPAAPVVTPTARTEIDADDDDERLRAVGRRGTQHLGLLMLRVGLAVVLGAHGLQKLFGWWGGQGLTGFKNSLSDVGYQHADILAYVSAGGEIAAGVLLVLGLFTPMAAAGALAFLINGLLAAISARPHSHSLPVLPAGRARIPDHPDRHGRRGHPGRTRPLRPRRRPRLGPSALHRVVRGAAGRHRAPASRCGCCSTASTRSPEPVAQR